MQATIIELGRLVREYIVFNVLRLIHKIFPNGYILVSVIDDEVLKFFTHYEGLQVIDELLLLNQYGRALKLRPRVVVDLGAHIGVFTILIAKRILNTFNDGLVISVEPASVNYLALVNNLKLNHVEKIVLPIRRAVASKPGSIEVTWLDSRETVYTITLDQILNIIKKKGYNCMDLVKIDIEGAELDILTNNINWLKHVNVLVMELHPHVYGFKGLKDIIKNLKEQGFNLIQVENVISSKLAFLKFAKNMVPNPSWLVIVIWKSLITLLYPEHRVKYFFAWREKKAHLCTGSVEGDSWTIFM